MRAIAEMNAKMATSCSTCRLQKALVVICQKLQILGSESANFVDEFPNFFQGLLTSRVN